MGSHKYWCFGYHGNIHQSINSDFNHDKGVCPVAVIMCIDLHVMEVMTLISCNTIYLIPGDNSTISQTHNQNNFATSMWSSKC